MKRVSFYAFLILLITGKGYAWNALGHRLIAQIAYQHLDKQSIRIYKGYNQALDKDYGSQNLVNSAAWLDRLRDESELKSKHYINLPFSFDGTRLIAPEKVNAVSAITEAVIVLQNEKASNFSKGFNLRILLHVVGDLHQPLHAASQFSHAYPQGDKGGNLVRLGRNTVAENLHAYWDRGGGFLSRTKLASNKKLKKKAQQIEKTWPCHPEKMDLNPSHWANESHRIAIKEAYSIRAGQKPSKIYQYKVKRLTEQRIALAGCRLAALLNKMTNT